MAKVKTAFFCKNCGTQYSKWQGQCHTCKEWNTIAEEVLQNPKTKNWNPSPATQNATPVPIHEVSENQQPRLRTEGGLLLLVLEPKTHPYEKCQKLQASFRSSSE